MIDITDAIQHSTAIADSCMNKIVIFYIYNWWVSVLIYRIIFTKTRLLTNLERHWLLWQLFSLTPSSSMSIILCIVMVTILCVFSGNTLITCNHDCMIYTEPFLGCICILDHVILWFCKLLTQQSNCRLQNYVRCPGIWVFFILNSPLESLRIKQYTYMDHFSLGQGLWLSSLFSLAMRKYQEGELREYILPRKQHWYSIVA